MATYQKFNCFLLDAFSGKHNLASDTLKVSLTNTAPNAETNTVFTDITEVSAANGYSAGGATAPFVSMIRSGGTMKLTLSDPSWTPTGAGIGPWRYAVLYNSTHASKPLIAFWDRGSSTTTTPPDFISIDFDAANGVFQAT